MTSPNFIKGAQDIQNRALPIVNDTPGILSIHHVGCPVTPHFYLSQWDPSRPPDSWTTWAWAGPTGPKMYTYPCFCKSGIKSGIKVALLQEKAIKFFSVHTSTIFFVCFFFLSLGEICTHFFHFGSWVIYLFLIYLSDHFHLVANENQVVMSC